MHSTKLNGKLRMLLLGSVEAGIRQRTFGLMKSRGAKIHWLFWVRCICRVHTYKAFWLWLQGRSVENFMSYGTTTSNHLGTLTANLI